MQGVQRLPGRPAYPEHICGPITFFSIRRAPSHIQSAVGTGRTAITLCARLNREENVTGRKKGINIFF